MADPVIELLAQALEGAIERQRATLTLRDKAQDKAGHDPETTGVDLVTDADLFVDSYVTDGLAALYPGVTMVSEEGEAGTREEPPEGDAFLLDPIDGTHNFTGGLPFWAISLARMRGADVEEAWLVEAPSGALYHATRNGPATRAGAPIRITHYEPRLCLASLGLSRGVLPLMASADRFSGIRLMGSHALSLAWVADGRFGLHAGRGFPWDVAAGALLVRRAGGLVVDFEGGERNLWQHGNTLAGTPQAVDVALGLIAGGFQGVPPGD